MQEQINKFREQQEESIRNLIGFIFNNNITKDVKISELKITYCDHMGIAREQKIKVDETTYENLMPVSWDNIETSKEDEIAAEIEFDKMNLDNLAPSQKEEDASIAKAIELEEITLPNQQVSIIEEKPVQPEQIDTTIPSVNDLRGADHRSIITKLKDSLKRKNAK